MIRPPLTRSARRYRLRDLTFAALFLLTHAVASAEQRFAIVVSGANGGDDYARTYAEWTAAMSAVLVERLKFDPANVAVLTDGPDRSTRSTSESVRRTFAGLERRMAAGDLLFVMLIGHGTYDGVDAKFNLVGPDLESAEWATLLGALPGRVVVVNTTGGSFPFIQRLSGERRIVITATDSAAQRFDTVFAAYFIKAFDEEGTDLDKNGRISVWEAFSAAAAAVRRHYQNAGQLATERALLDDNGDGIGREASAPGEDGSAASRTYLDQPVAGAPPTDEVLIQLLQKRSVLEAEIEELKIRRSFLPAAEYQKEFERLMIELARVARAIRERVKS